MMNPFNDKRSFKAAVFGCNDYLYGSVILQYSTSERVYLI